MRAAPTKLTFVLSMVFISVLFWASLAQSFLFEDRRSIAKAMAHYTMGQMYDLLGQTNRAILEYEKSAQFDEGNYLAHLRLGANYARLDMLTKAKDSLELVKQHNPDDLQSHYLLALIHSTEQDYDAAAQEYEYILQTFSQSEPKNIEIYGYLGQLYYSQKKYDKAIEQFERILSFEPENADVLYLLGSLYIEVDENKKAIALLKQSLAIDENHDGSLNTLGYLYADQGTNLDEAEEMIQKALDISPGNGAYLDSLGWVQYQRGDFEEALKTFELASMVLKDPIIYEHIGDTHWKLDQYDEAIQYWEMSLELLPDQPQVQEKIRQAQSIRAKNFN